MGSNGLCTTPCATTFHVPKHNWSCWAEWATRLESAIMNTSPSVCKWVSSTSAPVQLHSQLYSWTPGNRSDNLDHQRDVSLPPSLLAKQEELTDLPHTRQVAMSSNTHHPGRSHYSSPVQQMADGPKKLQVHTQHDSSQLLHNILR